MSLLRGGSDLVTVFPEIVAVDVDGNKISKASAVGMVARASVQPVATSEKADGGFETEARYRLRLAGYVGVLGAQSQVEWNGQRWSIEGEPKVYNGSARTRHIDYTMRRA